MFNEIKKELKIRKSKDFREEVALKMSKFNEAFSRKFISPKQLFTLLVALAGVFLIYSLGAKSAIDTAGELI